MPLVQAGEGHAGSSHGGEGGVPGGGTAAAGTGAGAVGGVRSSERMVRETPGRYGRDENRVMSGSEASERDISREV